LGGCEEKQNLVRKKFSKTLVISQKKFNYLVSSAQINYLVSSAAQINYLMSA
jgi:hypothetical protein